MNTTKPYPLAKTTNTEALREEGPMILSELPGGHPDGEERNYVFSLQLPGSRKYGGGKPTAIAFLIGDERRAVRKFIEVNEGYVESCMEASSNVINANVDDFMWALFCEEWYWDRMEEVPSQVYQGPAEGAKTETYRDDHGRLVAPRKISGSGSKTIVVPPEIKDEANLSEDDSFFVHKNERGILYSTDELDMNHLKTLTLIQTRKDEEYTGYAVTVPAEAENFKNGDIAEIVVLGEGKFILR